MCYITDDKKQKKQTIKRIDMSRLDKYKHKNVQVQI